MINLPLTNYQAIALENLLGTLEYFNNSATGKTLLESAIANPELQACAATLQDLMMAEKRAQEARAEQPQANDRSVQKYIPLSASHAQQLEIIAVHFPELTIERYDNTGKYTWSFRCCSSEDDHGKEFDSPVEALAHFAADQSEILDNMLKPEEVEEEEEA